MDTTIAIIVVFALLELYENRFTKGSDVKEIILYQYSIYRYSLIMFILINPTLFYLIGISIYLDNYSLYMNIAIILKFIDISFKIYLFSKIDRESINVVNSFLPINTRFNSLTKYLNFIVYTSLLSLAILN